MTSPNAKFTGRHMAAVFVGGFGIVIAVNLVMASFAVGSFHGTVVDNSYVASQKFNGWMQRAENSRALGWEVTPSRRADGRVMIETRGVPAGAVIAADLRRPLGAKDVMPLTFGPAGEGRWLSNEIVSADRWTLRIAITAPDQEWAGTGELK